MKTKRIIMMVALMVMFSAMAMAQGLIGKWNAKAALAGEDFSPYLKLATFQFNKDNSFQFKIGLEMGEEIQPGVKMSIKVLASLDGTYTADGQNITINQKEDGANIDLKLDFPGMEEEQKAMIMAAMKEQLPAMKKQFAEEMSGALKNETSTYEVNGDNLTIDGQVLTRIKK